MADQAITALPKKTYSGSSQIASTDYLLGIDSAEGYQMLIQDLGEYIINRATASLAGSTQTLASAISALNSNSWSLSGGTAIPANANINTYSTPGNFGTMSSADARTMDGLPFAKGNTSNFAFNLKVENSAYNDPNARRQVLQFFNDRQKWIRYGSISSGSVNWNEWEREPSRAELFTEGTASLSANFGTVYSNSVWRIGSLAFYVVSAQVTTEIANNTTVLTLPHISLYRHDSTFLHIDGTHICDAYLSANSQTLKCNGAVLPAGSNIKVSGFYQIK